MTEQEVIEYLKNNKNEGRIISFMPEEVKRWCEKHIKELLVWQSHRWYDAVDICTDDVVTLPIDYQVKEKPSGEWIEFELKDGMFYEVQRGTFYSWHEWIKFMADNPSFTHFGGYYYGIEPVPRWYMTECVAPTDCNGSIYTSYTDGDKNIKPLTPKKIRFWRESK